MIKKYYRVFEEGKDGMPHSIFHGTNKSRKLSLDTWIKADVKYVQDGKGKKKYLCGFHILPTLKETRQLFLKMFKHFENRYICSVYADEEMGMWEKPTNKKIMLANYIKITKQQWKNRKLIK